MRNLRLASYGIHGAVGNGLDLDTVLDFAAAFGTFMERGRVLVGRDTRHSSGMLHSGVVSALLSTGCDVVDFDVCPNPILQFAVPLMGAAGAVSVSGGHSPMNHNGLQLIGSRGAYIEPVVGETVLDIYHARDFTQAPWNRIGSASLPGRDVVEAYFDALAGQLDVAAIRGAGFSVIIDTVNGAGCRYVEPFARRLGFRAIPVNDVESGHLAHDPEPRPRNARQVAAFMHHVPADIGFVSSSDMGRLSVVSETGETASEEYTFPIIANHILGRAPGGVVTNCCTTRMLDDVAARHGAPVTKTPVGQAYVISALADEDGVIGGEGNGSVALPSFSRAFDAFLMMGLILEAMAVKRVKASGLIGELPRYHIVKRAVVGEPYRIYRALESVHAMQGWRDGGKLSAVDGLRVDWDDGWIHLRASQSAPIVRVISESRDMQSAENRAIEAARMLEHLL